MDSKFKNDISALKKKTYTYSIDVLSFAKSLKKSKIKLKHLTAIIETAANITESIRKINDLNDKNQIVGLLKKSSKFADNNLKKLQKFECKGSLLNEKTDLIIETWSLIESLKSLLQEDPGKTDN